MNFQLPYGHSELTVALPDNIAVDIIESAESPAISNPQKAVQTALDDLLGTVTWSNFAGVNSVGIAVNDKTRPVPHQHLLPPLLKRLASLGISDEAITFYIAAGMHAPMQPEEYPAILPPEILRRYEVVSHNAEDRQNLAFLGETQRGTPVWANKAYVQADLKIVVGNIEPHQFIGFSGGVKSAAIGLAGPDTIRPNHALMTDPDSSLGEFENNPARQDVEEIGQKIRVHLALNAILNADKQIVHVLAGDPVVVMRAGIPLASDIYQAPIHHRYSLMIASPGGHPKDINVYQSQKGLSHAARVTRSGGTILMVAACPEGSGSKRYENWVRGKNSHNEVMRQFKAEGFQIGPHKAYQIAREATKIKLMWYSELAPQLAQMLMLNPVSDLQSVLNAILDDLPPGERVGVLPLAASAIPHLGFARK